MAKNIIGVQEDRKWFSTAIGSNILKRRIIYYFLDNNLNLFLTLVVTFNRPRIPLRLFQAVLNATHQNLFLYGSDKNGLRYNLSKFGNWALKVCEITSFRRQKSNLSRWLLLAHAFFKSKLHKTLLCLSVVGQEPQTLLFVF